MTAGHCLLAPPSPTTGEVGKGLSGLSERAKASLSGTPRGPCVLEPPPTPPRPNTTPVMESESARKFPELLLKTSFIRVWLQREPLQFCPWVLE